MRDVNAQILAMFFGFWPPNLTKNVAMSEYASRMPDEQSKQRIFGGGQLDFPVCSRDDVRRKIDNQIAVFEYRDFFGWTRFALRSTQPREQFRRAERLGDVVLGASIESGDFFLFIIANRQNNDWHFAPFAQTFQNFEAVHVRQAEIEKDDNGLAVCNFDQALLAVLGLVHSIILTFECDPQESPNLHLVIDDERDRFHFAGETPAAKGLAPDAFSAAPVAANSVSGNRISSPIGKRIEKIAPPPSRLCATIWPLCASTSCRAIARPKPRPPGRVRGPR